MSRSARDAAAGGAQVCGCACGTGVAVWGGMKGRAIAVRIILGVAALTTVATSAPADFELTSLAERRLEGGTVRVSAVANRTAADHADQFVVRLDVSTDGAPVTVTL